MKITADSFSHLGHEPPEFHVVHTVLVTTSSCGTPDRRHRKPGSLNHTVEGELPAHLRKCLFHRSPSLGSGESRAAGGMVGKQFLTSELSRTSSRFQT